MGLFNPWLGTEIKVFLLLFIDFSVILVIESRKNWRKKIRRKSIKCPCFPVSEIRCVTIILLPFSLVKRQKTLFKVFASSPITFYRAIINTPCLDLINWLTDILILTACSPLYGYFMTRGWGIAFFTRSYLDFFLHMVLSNVNNFQKINLTVRCDPQSYYQTCQSEPGSMTRNRYVTHTISKN